VGLRYASATPEAALAGAAAERARCCPRASRFRTRRRADGRRYRDYRFAGRQGRGGRERRRGGGQRRRDARRRRAEEAGARAERQRAEAAERRCRADIRRAAERERAAMRHAFREPERCRRAEWHRFANAEGDARRRIAAVEADGCRAALERAMGAEARAAEQRARQRQREEEREEQRQRQREREEKAASRLRAKAAKKQERSSTTRLLLLSHTVRRAERAWRFAQHLDSTRACLVKLPDSVLDDAVDEPLPEAIDEAVNEPLPEAIDDAVNEPLPETIDDAVNEPLPVDDAGEEGDNREVALARSLMALLRDALADRSDFRVDERHARTLLCRDGRVGRSQGRPSEFPGMVFDE